jgi:opacity protein-like surface antigen
VKGNEMKNWICAFCLLAATPAAAQDWSYDASIYLWFPQTNVTVDTPLGTVEGELSISDALQDLDFAFMGAIEARNGPWGIVGDFVYFDISSEAPTPRGLLFSDVAVDTKLTLLSAYGLYRFHEDATVSLDFGVGLRAVWADTKTSFVGNLASPRVFEADDNWVDPLLAARLKAKFSEDWYGALFLDGGGFGVGSDSTYQVLATVGYQINERWAVQGGYRYLAIDKDSDDSSDIDIDLSGPIIGAVYSF